MIRLNWTKKFVQFLCGNNSVFKNPKVPRVILMTKWNWSIQSRDIISISVISASMNLLDYISDQTISTI